MTGFQNSHAVLHMFIFDITESDLHDMPRWRSRPISTSLALAQERPQLPINSFAQRAPPVPLSLAVYITAAKRKGQIGHIMIPAVMQISGHILQFVLSFLTRIPKQTLTVRVCELIPWSAVGNLLFMDFSESEKQKLKRE